MAALRTAFRKDIFLGKVAIVTGGGTGIGRAITKELALLGCRVVIASRKMDQLETAAAAINHTYSRNMGGAAGGGVFPFQCNIRSEDQVCTLADRVPQSFTVYIHVYELLIDTCIIHGYVFCV